MQEVKQHKTEEDAWTVLRGRVYNISPYIRFHPGGLHSSLAAVNFVSFNTEFHSHAIVVADS